MVVEQPDDQPTAVADVLDRMGQIVDQTGRDPPEHRLPLLSPDVLLQLVQLHRHAVERFAQLVELVGAADVDPLLQPPAGDRLCSAGQRQDWPDERPAPVVAERNRQQQRHRDKVAPLSRLAMAGRGMNTARN